MVLTLIVVLAAVVVHIVNVGFQAESDIRSAQIARSNLTRAQLDQETGVRGYTSTNDPTFLQPYRAALRTFPRNLQTLREAIARSNISAALPIVNDMAALHGRWISTVAAPLLRASAQHNAIAIQLRGKVLIDRFRADNRRLEALLEADATRRDGIAKQIVFWLFVLVLAVIVAVAGLLYIHSRSAAVLQSALAKEEDERRRTAGALEAQQRLLASMQRLFTQQALPRVATLTMDAVYMPASVEAKIGGDWYDAIELPDGRVLFSIGDVAGHGVEAAVAMILVRQAIIASAVATTDPAEILRKANVALRLQNAIMATAICGYIDPASMVVTYSIAGHPPPMMLGADGVVSMLPFGGVPLGIGEKLYNGTYTIQAEPGSRLVLYTDGVTECTRDVLAGEEALIASILAHRNSLQPAQAISDDIFHQCVPADDVAILAITFGDQDRTGAQKQSSQNAYAFASPIRPGRH